MASGLRAPGADFGFGGRGVEKHGVGCGICNGRYGVNVAGQAVGPRAAGVVMRLDSGIWPGNGGGDWLGLFKLDYAFFTEGG
jgi:hypothetical protein